MPDYGIYRANGATSLRRADSRRLVASDRIRLWVTASGAGAGNGPVAMPMQSADGTIRRGRGAV